MPVTFTELAERLGETFTFATSAGAVDLTLETATQAGPGGALVFTGPSSPPLDQGTYPFAGAGLDDVLFIVPVSESGDVRRYEAVFS